MRALGRDQVTRISASGKARVQRQRCRVRPLRSTRKFLQRCDVARSLASFDIGGVMVSYAVCRMASFAAVHHGDPAAGSHVWRRSSLDQHHWLPNRHVVLMPLPASGGGMRCR